ncbi:Uncharacterized membrane-anchored protein [Actinacidiphila rubida]|uniref:Uncharacterized membrane-anchored protein n=1 Tax=Actinacidiphila rubida TaxID=310780 RepID=A0A1H8R1J0_9ACTN|nr:hypothetical protein [Actinacidiphila rubida]SEO60282.1 Uncharacterized membrane-anchored protein [Actinacidiphila rubida]
MEQSGYGNTVAAETARTGPAHRRRGAADPRAWTKVPVRITAWFWLAKVLTTGMGETTSDFLGHALNPAVAGAIGLLGLAGALLLQFRVQRYSPWIYWLAVVMVSVFGTMAADVVHVVAGVPYAVSTVAFSVLLVVVLTAWYRSEGTLSIHSISTPRRERFYWATVLTTFALGTACGDLTAGTLHLGYFSSGVLFAVAIVVPALARLMGLNAVAAFWWAYILTRPLGASFADWMGVPTHRGGLGWGTGPVSLALAALIVVAVGYLAAEDRRSGTLA